MSFENWDLLSPQEQARRLSEHVANNAVPQLMELRQQMAAAIAQREQFFANYMGVMREAFSRKLSNPELDLNTYIQKAIEYSTGKISPLDAAYSDVTSAATQKKMQDEWTQKAKEDALQSLSNPPQDEVPHFKKPAMSRTAVKDAVRSDALNKGISWNDSDWVPPASTQGKE